MIKALVIGDNHFKVNNVQETDEMTKRLIALAEKETPDFIVLLGDILHRHETIHVVPLMGCEKMIKGLSNIAPTFICIGNHDRPNNSNFLTDEHPFNAMKEWRNVQIADKVLSYTPGSSGQPSNFKFVFVPYVPCGRFMEAINTLKNNEKVNNDNTLNNNTENKDVLEGVTCIFAHQEFFGAKMGAIVSESGDKWPLENPLVVSGHIHDYDMLQDNIIYTGTPIQDGFGDRSTDKTVSIFTFSCLDNKLSWKQDRVDLGLPKRITVYLSPSDIHNYEPPENRVVKIVVRGPDAEIKACMKLEKIKELKKKGVLVAFKTTYEIKEKDENQKENLPANMKVHRYTYKERLVSELRGDTLKWFKKIFTS